MRLPLPARAQASVPPPAPLPTMMTSQWFDMSALLVDDAVGGRRRGTLAASEPAPASLVAGRLRRRDRDPDHVRDLGPGEAVVHLHHRLRLRRPRVGCRLAWSLVRPQAGLLVHLGARVPEEELRGHVAR